MQPRRTAGVPCCEGGHLTVPAIRVSTLLEPQRRASSEAGAESPMQRAP